MLGLPEGGDRTTESIGDFYAIALHDDQLRAGLVATHHRKRARRSPRARAARSALAALLRALAALVDGPPPVAIAEGPIGVAG
jgi:hypothetical protein